MRDETGNLIDDGNFFLSCKRPKKPSEWGNIVTTIKLKTIPPIPTGQVTFNFHVFCGGVLPADCNVDIIQESYAITTRKRETIWTLSDDQKYTGDNYWTTTDGNSPKWKHISIDLKPSRYERQLTLSSTLSTTDGSLGYDNILFTTNKKCLPQWKVLYGYKFHQDIATSDFYKKEFQDRKDIYFGSDVTESDMQAKRSIVTKNVNSLEECSRYCVLGSQCDMFEYDTSNDQCRFFPHLQMKNKKWIDVLQQIDDLHPTDPTSIYILQCAGAENIAKGTDLITKSFQDDWTATTNCANGEEPGLAEDLLNPEYLYSTNAGYLYTSLANCSSNYTYKLEQTTSATPVVTEDYISTFKPSAYARVFGRALINSCPQTDYNDPMYVCGPDDIDYGQLKLRVSINGVETEKNQGSIKEKGLLYKTTSISASLDSYVYVPFFEIETGNIGLMSQIKSDKPSGQYLSMNPPEMIVDDVYNAGCFNITDPSLLGAEANIDNIAECAVSCKQGGKSIAAFKESSCYCLENIPYESLYYHEDCIDFYIAECESGWKKFGDSCYKKLEQNQKIGQAQDSCADEGGNIFFPESHEEMRWVETFLASGENLYIGFRGYDSTTKHIINMDHSEHPGTRHVTRMIIMYSIIKIIEIFYNV